MFAADDASGTPEPPERAIQTGWGRLRSCDGDFLLGTRDAPFWPGGKLIRRLIANGAPKHFLGHLVRHTPSTWLRDQGHSLWEAACVSITREVGVTATHYSFGHSGDLKLRLLTKWEDHLREVTGAGLPGELGDEPSRWATMETALHQHDAPEVNGD